MTNYNLHNDCKALSEYVYKANKPKIINGWKYNYSSQSSNGFYSEIYTKENSIIIIFKGTDFNRYFAKDLDDDIFMDLLNRLPGQLKNARSVYIGCRRSYPNANIILTGHSLGGSIAQALGTETGAKTITFSAYGVGNLHDVDIKHTDNITNYGNAQDGVYVKNIDNQLGKTIILNVNKRDGEIFNKVYKFHGISPHFLENIGDLSKGVEYKKSVFENDEAPLFKIGIEYNDFNPDEVFDISNRVLYRGEINLEDLKEGTPLYDLYLDQWLDRKPMPTKKEVDKRTRIGELIYVEEYIRSDGTKVSGYYRAYPRR